MNITATKYPILNMLPRAAHIGNLVKKWMGLEEVFEKRNGEAELANITISVKKDDTAESQPQYAVTVEGEGLESKTFSGIELRAKGKPVDIGIVPVADYLAKNINYDGFNAAFNFMVKGQYVVLHSVGSLMPLSSNLDPKKGICIEGGNDNFIQGLNTAKNTMPIEMICAAACRYMHAESANRFIGEFLAHTMATDKANDGRAPDILDAVTKVMQLSEVEPLAADHPYVKWVDEFKENPNPFSGKSPKPVEKALRDSLQAHVESGFYQGGKAAALIEQIDAAHKRKSSVKDGDITKH